MPPVTNSVIESLIQELTELRIRVAQLEAAAHEPDPITDGSDLRSGDDLRPGDRVFIKNKVKRPASWDNQVAWNQQAAQRATVTHQYREQIHFRTDNGVTTWRARNNLSRILNDATL